MKRSPEMTDIHANVTLTTPAPQERKTEITTVFFGCALPSEIDIRQITLLRAHNKFRQHQAAVQEMQRAVAEFDAQFEVGTMPSLALDDIDLPFEEKIPDGCTCRGCVMAHKATDPFSLLLQLCGMTDSFRSQWQCRTLAGAGTFIGTLWQAHPQKVFRLRDSHFTFSRPEHNEWNLIARLLQLPDLDRLEWFFHG